MPIYYLHVRGGAREFLDLEGSDLSSPKALHECVLRSAKELMIHGIQHGVLDLRCRIDAEDAKGRVVYSLPFSHAVSIIPETNAE